jgi:hypothetical protein
VGATFASSSDSNKYFIFEGDDYVSIGQPLGTGASYTIEAWVNSFTTNGTGRNIVSSNESPLWINNGILYAGVGGNYTAVSQGGFPIYSWQHVAVTFDDATDTMLLY